MLIKSVLAATAVCIAIGATPASAMPMNNMAAAAPSNAEQVRMVCGPRRCWSTGPYAYRHHPGYYAYGAYGGPVVIGPRYRVGPRFYGYGPRVGRGFHRGWRHR
jgi:hypothetical protein